MKKDAAAAEGAALDAGILPAADVGNAGAGEGAAPAPVVDPAREWAEIPQAVGMTLSIRYRELQNVYTDDACLAWGKAMAPIAERYGWTPGKVFPWLSLIGATAMLGMPTVEIIKAHALLEAAAPAVEKGPLATVTTLKTAAPADTGDVDLQDPTKKNPPPRPVS